MHHRGAEARRGDRELGNLKSEYQEPRWIRTDSKSMIVAETGSNDKTEQAPARHTQGEQPLKPAAVPPNLKGIAVNLCLNIPKGPCFADAADGLEILLK